jgi:hypothetical protein
MTAENACEQSVPLVVDKAAASMTEPVGIGNAPVDDESGGGMLDAMADCVLVKEVTAGTEEENVAAPLRLLDADVSPLVELTLVICLLSACTTRTAISVLDNANSRMHRDMTTMCSNLNPHIRFELH